ncbi:MAG TPA: hypothetical protein VKA76_07095 [Gammaproteobacteria bacterium]|nr:hypothetical protein [Gammaproteobacteria bacterium]
MSTLIYWLGGVFLPLFPLSMAFNVLFSRVRNAKLRVALLLVWPQLGLSLAYMAHRPIPVWCLVLALFTSVLYAFRAIGLREVGQWIGYLATSAWALLWVGLFTHSEPNVVRLYAVGFSLPLMLLTLLGARLERGFGAAYTGLYGGLAQTVPRMSGVLVGVVLAIVAAPLFPAFSAMLGTVIVTTPTMPLAALTVALVWLLWTWAGVRLLQGLIVGPADGSKAADLSLASTWAYVAVLVLLLAGGFYLTGDLP